MLGRQFLERVGVTESSADDDVGAALDEFLHRRLDRRRILRNVLDKLDRLANTLLDFYPCFVKGLGPATIFLRTKIDHGDFGWAFERKAIGRRCRTDQRAQGAGRE